MKKFTIITGALLMFGSLGCSSTPQRAALPTTTTTVSEGTAAPATAPVTTPTTAAPTTEKVRMETPPRDEAKFIAAIRRDGGPEAARADDKMIVGIGDLICQTINKYAPDYAGAMGESKKSTMDPTALKVLLRYAPEFLCPQHHFGMKSVLEAS